MLRKFVKDLAVYSPSQFLPALTAFITTPILTRLFPPAEYGYWALATSVSAFLVALAVSGFGSAVLRFYPLYEANSKLNGFYATLTVTVAAFIAVTTGLGFLALYVLRSFVPPVLHELLPLVMAIFVTQSIFTVFTSLLRAQGRSQSFTFLQLVTNYGALGIGLLLVMVFGFRIDGLLWGTLTACVVSLPFLILHSSSKVGIRPGDFEASDAMQILNYAWPLMLSNVAMWGLRVSDLFIIGAFRPDQDVGLYSVSYNISSKSIELLVALFLLSLSPLIYHTWEREGRGTTERALTMVTRVYLILCLPAAVGLSVLGLPFVQVLTSPAYFEGYRIVGFVVFSSFLWGLSNIAMMGLAIKKQTRRLAANTMIAASTHVTLQLLLVPRFGYVASAISTLIGYALLLILHASASQSHLSWRFPFITLRNAMIASSVMGSAAWGIYALSGASGKASPAYLSLSVLVALPLYAVCLWSLGEIRVEEKQAIVELWSRLREGKRA